MSATNLLNSEKGLNLLPPPAIFLSEATSDGEDTGEETKDNKGPRLVKCEAVLTDVEYSSDEEVNIRKCASPVAVNCSSESQVVERVYQRKTQNINDELTDTENMCASDDEDFLDNYNAIKENEIEVGEEGVVTISDKVKTNIKSRNRFGTSKNIEIKYPRNCSNINKNSGDDSDGKNYLTPVNKLAKKKKKKGKVLLESCLTDTEDVDVPSDVDEINRSIKKDVSYTIFPSEKEEQDYTNRIKHTSSTRGTEKYTFVEFLTDKIEEGGVTDTDDIVYSDCEDAIDAVKDTEYEVDFSNVISNKETFVQGTPERKYRKKRLVKTDDDTRREKLRSLRSPVNNYLTIGKQRGKTNEDISSALTDTEDVYSSDVECGSSRPKCPTPEFAFYEDSTVLQNEKLTIMQALEALSDADPLTDCEELLFANNSPRRPKRYNAQPKMSNLTICDKAEGVTDTEELYLSDGNAPLSEISDTTGAESCSETDVELCSNLGDFDEIRCRVPSVTPDCIRHLDNTYISNVEGSESYLKQVKGKKSRSLSAGPLVIDNSLVSPSRDTDSEDFQTEDETAEEFTYNRALTPSIYFEKFNLEDESSSVIHEKNTRSFQTDGDESLHIKGASHIQEPVTDSEDIGLLD